MGYMQGLFLSLKRNIGPFSALPCFPVKTVRERKFGQKWHRSYQSLPFAVCHTCFIPLQACLLFLFPNLQSFLVHSPLSLSGLVDWIVILLTNSFRFMRIFGLIIAFFFLKMILVRWVKAQIHSPFRSYAVASSGKLQLPKK